MTKERPGGVTIVALLNLLAAGFYALALSPWDPFLEHTQLARVMPLTSAEQTTFVTAVLVIAIILHALTGIGLFLMEVWAWRLAILLTGVGLAVYLFLDWRGDPTSLRLAIFAGIAFYLNTRRVRDAFVNQPQTEEPVPHG